MTDDNLPTRLRARSDRNEARHGERVPDFDDAAERIEALTADRDEKDETMRVAARYLRAAQAERDAAHAAIAEALVKTEALANSMYVEDLRRILSAASQGAAAREKATDEDVKSGRTATPAEASAAVTEFIRAATEEDNR